MIQWHVGCSGFYYKHWKEIFYPAGVPQRAWFEYYCRHFSTLELNVTFYRFPQLPMLQKWYNGSSPDFSFSVKAPKLITHFKKLNDCETLISDFYHVVNDGLKEKVGCFLFQFPPRFNYTAERLDKIISSLDPALPNIVEFRHSSWWDETIYTSLGKHHISFSGMSHPLLPATIVSNTSLLYYRMHGVPDLYKSPYSPGDIKKIIRTIKKSGTVRKAFIYFNNDIGGSAIKNATEMNSIIKPKKNSRTEEKFTNY
jgi:uncharacterized protein YecE (DUF72 family)